MSVGTNVGRHKCRQAQVSLGTTVAGHKCRWAQVSGGHKFRKGTYVASPSVSELRSLVGGG